MTRRWHWRSALVSCCVPAVLTAQPTVRTLRVVDSVTSKPLALAEVILAGRATIRTSDSGLVTLASLNPGATRVRVRRVGYQAKEVVLEWPGSDTAAFRIALAPVAQSLPSVTAEAVRDPKLEMMGFYSRRQSSAAPKSAFVTADDIARWKPTLLTDIKYKTGHDIARCSKYVDGVHVAEVSTRGNTLRRGIDALVQPSEVAALEVYRLGEAPARFTPTQSGSSNCILLIWLK